MITQAKLWCLKTLMMQVKHLWYRRNIYNAGKMLTYIPSYSNIVTFADSCICIIIKRIMHVSALLLKTNLIFAPVIHSLSINSTGQTAYWYTVNLFMYSCWWMSTDDISVIVKMKFKFTFKVVSLVTILCVEMKALWKFLDKIWIFWYEWTYE